MPRSQNPGVAAAYQAAARFVDAALRHDDSLFMPGTPIWSPVVLDDFYARFVLQPDHSRRTFEEKLEQQLEGAAAETYQLAGELLFVHFLITDRIHGETRRTLIRQVLDWSPAPVPIPSDLAQALDAGIAATGTFFNTGRDRHLTFLTTFARSWKELSREVRQEALADPWAFKRQVWAVEVGSAYIQREALLHLVFPDTFEPIVSRAHKPQIAQAFTHLVAEPTDDIDRQLAQIRARLAEQHGPDFSFYSDALKPRWQPGPWDIFIAWAERFYRWEGFERDERDYKLAISDQLRQARAALLEGADDWPQVLLHAFRLPGYNLTIWRVHQPFLEWCRDEPAEAAGALRAIWAEEGRVEERIRGFLTQLPVTVPPGRGGRTSLASLLLMALDPQQFPIYRETPVVHGLRFTSYPQPPRGADEAETYAHALGFFDRVLEEAQRRGLVLRDRLDAQSIVYSVTIRGLEFPPVPEWSEEEQQALRAYRGRHEAGEDDEDGVPPPDGDNRRPLPRDPLDQLADRLLLDRGYLERIGRLLEAKGQVIFYGPPGTGKTYVARELARHYGGSDDRTALVQLHPAYSYEDFVEGYRPHEVGGQPGFHLLPGPLKRIAQAASQDPDHRYVLIIDELNRGNVAKVFGELYFLLEYRNERMSLAYSAEPFALPPNLWLIGSMNTADRSIALVDAALRRRFYFVPFFPEQPPVAGLLGRWLRRHKPDLAWVAHVVDEANRRLGSGHIAIGPSHFLRPDLSEEWVELIWEHAILPYLTEQFFGEEAQLERFSLPALRLAVSTAALPGTAMASENGRDAAADAD